MEKKNEFCLQEIKGRKAVTCIETHTEGEPTRTILSGFPEIPGNTMEEKMLYMMQEQDWMRKAICFEPRGNDVCPERLLPSRAIRRQILVFYITRLETGCRCADMIRSEFQRH